MFQGQRSEQLLQHLAEHPDLSEMPLAVRPVIERAIHKQPRHRYQSVDELIEAFLLRFPPDDSSISADSCHPLGPVHASIPWSWLLCGVFVSLILFSVEASYDRMPLGLVKHQLSLLWTTGLLAWCVRLVARYLSLDSPMVETGITGMAVGVLADTGNLIGPAVGLLGPISACYASLVLGATFMASEWVMNSIRPRLGFCESLAVVGCLAWLTGTLLESALGDLYPSKHLATWLAGLCGFHVSLGCVLDQIMTDHQSKESPR
ncbi:MAG: hypothetical protein KDA84_15285 [Planctomycetaceae bacterium]|nr:hypothetical protein [Planctomycetaceae bacterium]